MSNQTESLLQLWYTALDQKIGIAIEVKPEDIRWLCNQLYLARQEANDDDLLAFRVILPPGGTEVWIVRKDTNPWEDDPQMENSQRLP